MRKQIFVAFLILYSVCMASPAAAQSATDELKNTSRWQQTDDDLKRMVEIKGRVEFTDDYTEVRDVTPGGYVKIEEEREGYVFAGSLQHLYRRRKIERGVSEGCRDN